MNEQEVYQLVYKAKQSLTIPGMVYGKALMSELKLTHPHIYNDIVGTKHDPSLLDSIKSLDKFFKYLKSLQP